MARETRDQLESSRARLAHAADRERRRADKLHEQLRRLENAVRDVARQTGTHRERSNAMWELGRRVPVKPRATINELRKGRRAR